LHVRVSQSRRGLSTYAKAFEPADVLRRHRESLYVKTGLVDTATKKLL